MNSTKNSSAPTLASILPMENLQAEVARRLMNMTISDLVKLAAVGEQPRVSPKPKVKTVKAKVKVKPKKARRVRRDLGPISERIERLLKGATHEWRSMSEIADAAGEDMPNGNTRAAMVNGYDGASPVLEWNGVTAKGARYRLAASVGRENDLDLI